MSITDIGKQEAQAILTSKTADSADGSEEPRDFQLDQYPTTAVSGTAENLIRCSHNRKDREFIGIALTDPYVYTEDAELKDTAIFSHTENDEFTLVNTEDDQTDSIDGVVIRPDNTKFRANQVEAFREAEGFDPDTDRVIVRLTGKEGRYIGLCLDKHGLQNTNLDRDSTGIPKLDSSEDLFDGVSLGSIGSNMLLRPELRGEEIILMRQHTGNLLDEYEGNSSWATVLIQRSGNSGGFQVVTPNIKESLRTGYNRTITSQRW